MHDVVAVVETATVVARVDAGDAVSVGIEGVGWIDEGVLTPVSNHHQRAHEQHGDDENHDGSLPTGEDGDESDHRPVKGLCNEDATSQTRAPGGPEIANERGKAETL